MFFQVMTRDGWVKYYNSNKIHMIIQKMGTLELSTLDGTTTINNSFSLVNGLLNKNDVNINFIPINGTYLNSDRIISLMDCNGFTEVICELKGTAQRIQIKESALFIIDSIAKLPSIKDFVCMSIAETEICLPVGSIFSFKSDGGKTLLTTDCAFGSASLPISPYEFYKLMSK